MPRTAFGGGRTWWWLVAAWCAAVFVLSAIPGSNLHLPVNLSDKALHGILYAGGSVLLTMALRLTFPRWSLLRTFLAAVVLTSAYGASDELHQAFVPGRATEFGDWIADTVGAAVGALVVLAFARRSATEKP